MGAEGDMLRAARGGDEGAFRALVEPHRRGVLAHCYRMCGSLQEAEELVQEAMLRAWRGLETFEERASVKTWLYRIATNATLDALQSAKRRTLPSAEGAPTAPDTTGAPVVEPIWLEPYPDALLPDEQIDQRRTIGFAFLQALQKLPASQRAALLLKDVVGSSAAEVADLLDTSSAAVNSMLQRARATLGEAEPPEPANDTELAVVRSYVEAFEKADVDALVTLLRDDARMSMPPVPSWYQGPEAIGGWLRANVLSAEAAGRYRGLPTRANGAPAVALYARRDGGGYALLGVHVLDVDGDRLAEVVAFMDPGVLQLFPLPPTLEP